VITLCSTSSQVKTLFKRYLLLQIPIGLAYLQTFTMIRAQQTSCIMLKDAIFNDLNGDDYCIDKQLLIWVRRANPSIHRKI